MKKTVCILSLFFSTIAIAQTTIVSIYPNPTSGRLTINLATTNDFIQVAIFNNFGQKVYSIFELNTNEMQIDTGLPSGIYYIQISNESKNITTQKLVIK